MRLAIGGISHETHTFASIKTTLEHFKEQELLYGEDLLKYFRGTGTEIGGMIDGAGAEGLNLIPIMYARATPSGIVTRDAFDYLLLHLLDGVKKEKDTIDGVLLSLHGAMVAEGVDDVEGYLLEQIRAIVGEEPPIVATLDLHANISELMIKEADVLIGYDTYPHVDTYERGREAVEVITQIIKGNLRPTTALEKPPILPAVQSMITDRPPMKDLMDLAHQMEEKDQVATITVSGGFPYSDVPFVGMSIVVTTNNDPSLARERARELKDLAWRRHREFVAHNRPVDEAVEEAIKAKEGPIILVDVADNVGGGAPGDGTVLLRSLLEHKAEGTVVVIADPEAASKAIAAGIGKEVDLKVGGKVDNLHGEPVAVKGRVRLISDGRFTYKGPYMTGEEIKMGPTVVLDCKGITLVLTTYKTMPFDLEQLRSLGIEPTDQKIIVVKSAIAWRAAYEPIAKRVIEVDTPGLCSTDLSRFNYQKVRRPIFPLDDI